tara:strand:- start:17088 stop:18104 length:1017 start_codon:yes stop_codon:yes gene_type:complete
MIYFKKTFFFLIITLIYILIFELITRTIIFIKTGNHNIYYYGLSKNINFEIVDLSDLKFTVKNNKSEKVKKINKKNSLKNSNKLIVWTFGASLTYGYSCGDESSSWPYELDELNEILLVKNFGFPAKYSEDSIKILDYNLGSPDVENPDIIIWAHRDEEKLAIHKGIKRNMNKMANNLSTPQINPIIHFILRLEKTSELNFTFFVIFDHILNKLNLIKKKNITKPSENDFKAAIENFKWNTLDAINLAEEYEVKNFILLSLVSDEDISKNYNTFLNEYFKIIKILEENQNVYFLNIVDHLSNEQIINIDKFFCTNRHFTLVGNRAISNIVNKILNKLN